MSIESAKAFVERMKNDEKFARKIKEFKNSAEIQHYLTMTGFDFTKQELDSLSGELTDEELASVAGGMGCIVDPIIVSKDCHHDPHGVF